MRGLACVVAIVAASVSWSALADAHSARCFDKATLQYFDCPTEDTAAPAEIVAPAPEVAPGLTAPSLGFSTGFYVGVHGGYGRARNEITVVPTEEAQTGLLNANGVLPTSLDNDDADGFLGGAQAGFNLRRQRFVFGPEVDIALTGIDDSNTFSVVDAGLFGTTTFTTTQSTRIDWLSTLRARFGVLLTPEVLAYATGGLAIADVERSGSFTEAGVSRFTYSDSDIRFGFTVGGGLEYALSERFSIRGDYLYINLDDEQNSAGPIDAASAFIAPNAIFADDDELSLHLARIGLNVRF